MFPSVHRPAFIMLLALLAWTPLSRAGDKEYSAVMAWGKLEAFETSNSGQLRQRTYDPETGAWSEWNPIADTVVSSSPSAVLANAGTRVAVFYRGPDGRLYHVFRDKGKAWTRPILLGGEREMKSGPDAVIVGDVLTVFARAISGGMMKIDYDKKADRWTRWGDVD